MMKLISPQPIGIFPLPAGYLLLPDGEGVQTVQTSLMQGIVPDELPPSLRYYDLALNGQIDEAEQALAGDESPIGRYNRFVLRSSPEAFARLRQELPEMLQPLLAVVGYTLGYTDTPPQAGDLSGEQRALVLMAQASDHLEKQRPVEAIPLIEAAIQAADTVSPILAAQLMGTLAETRREVEGSSYALIQLYQAALTKLEPSALEEIKAEQWLNLGITYQEISAGQRQGLVEAVKCYQAALYVFKKETHPDHFALCQTNLALAYLTMPMKEASDQLRMGIAVQSLREALEIYRPDTHPDQWASAQLNLANALQYLPSSHPAENLAQAVELYEEILSVRSPIGDPVGFARVQANQANALAHLGIFDHAQTKLNQALPIFELYGDAEAAQSVRDLLAQIAAGQSTKAP